MSLHPGQLTWFFHPNSSKFPAVAVVRDRKRGAFVVGGPTGSHYTSPGESWKKKRETIVAMGCIEVSEARNSGILPPLWRPPTIPQGDAELLEKIRDGLL